MTAPVVSSAPTAHIPTGGTAATSGMPLVVRWTATDAATDILDQHLELSSDVGASWAAVTGVWPSLDVLPPTERAATGQRLRQRTARIA